MAARNRQTSRDRQTSRESESSGKGPVIEIEGEIVDSLPNTTFLVKPIGPDGKPLRISTDNNSSDDEPQTILAHLSGKMRLRFIRCGVGDRVRLQLSPYDLTRGRITWRLRTERVER